LQILIISEFYHPDPAAGQRVAEAASALAARGHTVRVLAHGRGGAERSPRKDGVEVERLRVPSEPGSSLFGKMAASACFELFAMLRALVSRQPLDVLLTVSTPPMCHVAGAIVSRLKGSAHIFWCADLHPESLFAIRALSPNSLAGRLLARANRWALGRCDAIVAVGRCMRERLAAQGAAEKSIVTVPMWHRDSLAMPPDPARVNALRSELQLGGRFVVMYSGNLGRMHHFEAVLGVAELLDRGFVFLFSGSGPGVEQLRAEAKRRGLEQIVIHSFFPEEILPEALALGDVHLITLRNSAAGVSVPGKLYGAMAAGRPVIFIGPAQSEVALTIQEERCGYVVAESDMESLAQALLALRADRARAEALGCRARAAFLVRYCQSRRCAQFSQAIERAVAEINADLSASRASAYPRTPAECQPSNEFTSQSVID